MTWTKLHAYIADYEYHVQFGKQQKFKVAREVDGYEFRFPGYDYIFIVFKDSHRSENRAWRLCDLATGLDFTPRGFCTRKELCDYVISHDGGKKFDTLVRDHPEGYKPLVAEFELCVSEYRYKMEQDDKDLA